MSDPKVTELTSDELELGTVDPANFPYQKMRGGMFWNGSAWEKMTGSSGYLKVQASILTSPIGVQGTVSITPSTTGTQSSVSSSAADGTILAANSTRLGGSIHNDSTQILYLLLASGTSSSSNYSVQVPSQGYFEIPFGYTGVIKGLWVSANGNARVTEYT